MSIYEEHFKPIQKGDSSRESKRMFWEESYEENSTAENYKIAFGVDLKEMVDKDVLDIGGKIGGKFSKEANTAGVRLITFNPKYFWKNRNRNEGVVAGIVQELPFKDESFDYVLSYATIPVYLPSFEEDYKNAFNNAFRVIKKGGKIIFFPVLGHILDSETYKEIKNNIYQSGGEIEEVFWGEEEAAGRKVKAYRVIIRKKTS